VEQGTFLWKGTLQVIFLAMLLLPISISLRLLTNSWYLSNNSFNKTGLGINHSHQPADAASFLMKNHLDGRIINSLGFGGWLSWALPQPVFIDGRLEVMQEALYQEITSSWNGDLQGLIYRYKPSLIVYNYLKYYPWTFQLKDMPEWRLVYLDGIAAIFAHEGYAPEIKAIDLTPLPSKEHLVEPHPFLSWAERFYKPVDYRQIDEMHKGLFHLQMRAETKKKEMVSQAALLFNQANDHYRKGDFTSALALYDSAIRIYPGYAKAYNNRGILKAFELKDYASAKKDFDKTLEIDPGNADAFLNRGTVNFYLKDADAACNDWQQALNLGNPQAARLLEAHCRRK
jgi:tetratricopeptide (TPR) repeat protein